MAEAETMIRAATPEDAKVFAAVVAASANVWQEWVGTAFTPFDEKELSEQWNRRLRQPDAVAFLATAKNGKVVVVGAAEPEKTSFQPTNISADSAHISTLYALPEAHGSGVAQNMHDHLIDTLALKGYRTVRLWTPAGAAQAQRFYLRNGWAFTGEETIGSLGLPRVEMRRALTAR